LAIFAAIRHASSRVSHLGGPEYVVAFAMPPFLYRCPNTGQNVQAYSVDDPDEDDLTFVQVTCIACAQAHLVNPKTSKVLGSDES
jgi:hypothetical protein